MPIFAMSLICFPYSSNHIHSMSNRLKMIRIAAQFYAAKMVKFHAVRSGPNQFGIRKMMSATQNIFTTDARHYLAVSFSV